MGTLGIDRDIIFPGSVPGVLVLAGFLVEWDADIQKTVRWEIVADTGGRTIVGVHLQKIKEGFYLCQYTML